MHKVASKELTTGEQLDLNPDDFKNYIAPLNNVTPEEIAQQFRIDVAEFIEHTFRPGTNQSLLIVGKKAGHLFQSFFRRFFEKGYGLTTIKNLKDNAFWTSGDIPKTVSLLTDCINSGNEILTIAKHVKFEGCKIDKIYSYASKIEGLAKLKKEEMIAGTPIISAHELEQNQSEIFLRRLQAYYQSWLEPVDIDHSYDIYRLPFNLTHDVFRSIIDSGCQNASGRSDIHFEPDENLYLPSNMTSMSMDLGDITVLKNIEFGNRLELLASKVEFDFPQLRAKAQFDTSGTQFCLMGCFPQVNLSPWVLGSQRNCSIRRDTKCYHDIIKSRIPIERRWKLVCPLCIENFVARLILDQIEKDMTTLFPTTKTGDNKPGEGAISVQKYNPIERQYSWQRVTPS
jgi:hypothetical protein